MMDPEDFRQRLDAMRLQMLDVAQRTGSAPSPENVVPELLEHLGTALEELSVTGEECRQQTEELAQTRIAAETERRWYQDLFENAPEGYLVTDDSGVIQEANQRAAQLLAVSREYLAGKPLRLFLAPAVRCTFFDGLDTLSSEAAQTVEWEMPLQLRDGTVIPALFRVRRVRNPSGSISLRWTLREVPARRIPPDMARDWEGRHPTMAALVRMTSRMAHHLQEQLTTIQARAEQLGASDLPPRFRADLDGLTAALTSLSYMVLRLQTFSRLRPLASPVPTDLVHLVHDMLSILRGQTRSRGIEFRVALGDLPRVPGHPQEIREAVLSLLLNAVEAMPQGGTLTISARSGRPRPDVSRAGPPWLGLTITDTGVGMADEVRQELYEPFFTTKGRERAGLGLAAVYGIMRRHGGAVNVRSAPGEGTSITLWFQLGNSETSASLPQPERSQGVLQLLVIGDMEGERRRLAGLLQGAGHLTVEAASGTEGLARLAEAPMDLVICELQMPGVDGWEVARAVKARWPTLPVILLANLGKLAGVVRDEPCPADLVVTTPVARERLLTIIAQMAARPPETPTA